MDTKPACPLCDKFGDRFTVDHLEGEKFSLEFEQLVAVPDTENDVFQCPHCGTYFKHIYGFRYYFYSAGSLDEQSISNN